MGALPNLMEGLSVKEAMTNVSMRNIVYGFKFK